MELMRIPLINASRKRKSNKNGKKKKEMDGMKYNGGQ